MLSIRSNMSSLLVQQNLLRSQSAMQTAMQRLSSGLRINSAADDPAGAAIANRMTAQITGLAQAQRNTSDGISLVQTAAGALDNINANLQRIRQLAVQAANGTNDSADLASLQAEITQRLSEVNRLAAQTRFNGKQLLMSNGGVNIQVGANDGESIHIGLERMDATALGLADFHVDGARLAGRDDLLSRMGAGDTVSINGQVWTRDADGVFTEAGGEVITDVTRLAMDLKTAAAAGHDATIQVQGQAYTVAAATGTVTDAAANVVYMDREERTLTTTPGPVATADPLATLDRALKRVDGLRSHLGAMHNRFESVIDNLGSSRINLSAARSRIQDADYAVEVSRMIRAQIQQQVGMAVLAQANQMPNLLLSLLRQSLS